MSHPSLVLLVVLFTLGSLSVVFVRAAFPRSTPGPHRRPPAAPDSAAASEEAEDVRRVIRAHRDAQDGEVELLVGLGEIGRRSVGSPVTSGASTPGGIYQVKRRMARLNDESESGLGLEGARLDCAGIAAGDAVAIRRWDNGPLVLGVVARSVPSTGGDTVVVGVRRLGTALREMEVTHESNVKERLLLVVGADTDGRDDAFLVSERSFAQGTHFSAVIEGKTYVFRFDRVRERGSGWLLAGFEVVNTRRVEARVAHALELAIAA